MNQKSSLGADWSRIVYTLIQKEGGINPDHVANTEGYWILQTSPLNLKKKSFAIVPVEFTIEMQYFMKVTEI